MKCLEASLSLPPSCWPHKESILSIKMIEGALSRAIWKRFETSLSLSSIGLETRSNEETLLGKKNKTGNSCQLLSQLYEKYKEINSTKKQHVNTCRKKHTHTHISNKLTQHAHH